MAGFPNWGDGQPLLLPNKPTIGLDYWGDGAPIQTIYNPTQVITLEDGIASAEAFGEEGVRKIISPSSIVSAEAFGEAEVITSLTIAPSSIDDSSVVGDHQIIPGPVTISVDGVASGEAVGDHVVAPTQIIMGFTWLKGETGTRGLVVTTQSGGIPSGYNPVWTYYAGAWRWIYFADTARNWIGRPAVMPGLLRLTVPESILSPDPYDSGADFGTHEVICGPVDVSPAGVVSGEVFGTAQINQFVLPSSIDSAEALGEPSVAYLIHPESIAADDDYGEPELFCGPVDVFPIGIISQEAVGEPLFGHGFRGIGIESEEAFGSVNVVKLVQPVSILPEYQVGRPNVLHLVAPAGIPEDCQVGTPNLVKLVRPVSIVTEEAIPEPVVLPGPVWAYPPTIDSAEAFGRPRVVPPKGLSNLIVLEVRYIEPLVLIEGQDSCDLYYEPLRMVSNE